MSWMFHAHTAMHTGTSGSCGRAPGSVVGTGMSCAGLAISLDGPRGTLMAECRAVREACLAGVLVRGLK